MDDRNAYEGQTIKLPASSAPGDAQRPPTYGLPAGADGSTSYTSDLPRTIAQPQPGMAGGSVVPRQQRARPWGGLLLIIGLLLLITGGFGRGLPIVSGFVDQTVTTSESYDARRLVLTIGDGDVTLVRGDDETLTIEQTKHGFGWNRADARRDAEAFEPTITQRGDEVVLEESAGINIALFGRTPYSDYRITLPADANVSATTGGGDIEGSELDGVFALAAGSGDVILSQIRGSLTIDVGSGSITVAESELSEAQLETGSGEIMVDGVQGELRANTGSGDIEVANVQSSALSLDTGSGNITIRNAEDATLSLDTGSGGIDFEGSLNTGSAHHASTGSGDLSLTLSGDASFELDAETGSGSIDLPRDWRATGDDSSRQAEVGEGGAALELRTSSGDITIQHN